MTKSVASVIAGLSEERFTPYRLATESDIGALGLYQWNTAISAAFWADISYFEVLVRNAMHQQLTQWSTYRYGESCWYVDPGGVLAPHRLTDIAEAHRRATTGRRAKPETPGRIVAELNFGFWRYLVSTHYDRTLWHSCLYKAFPGQGKRSRLHALFVQLHELRNRIAHHEPIHGEQLMQRHEELLTVLKWVDPVFSMWVRQQPAVPRQLAVHFGVGLYKNF